MTIIHLKKGIISNYNGLDCCVFLFLFPRPLSGPNPDPLACTIGPH